MLKKDTQNIKEFTISQDKRLSQQGLKRLINQFKTHLSNQLTTPQSPTPPRQPPKTRSTTNPEPTTKPSHTPTPKLPSKHTHTPDDLTPEYAASDMHDGRAAGMTTRSVRYDRLDMNMSRKTRNDAKCGEIDKRRHGMLGKRTESLEGKLDSLFEVVGYTRSKKMKAVKLKIDSKGYLTNITEDAPHYLVIPKIIKISRAPQVDADRYLTNLTADTPDDLVCSIADKKSSRKINHSKKTLDRSKTPMRRCRRVAWQYKGKK